MKIFITQEIPEVGINKLRSKSYEVVISNKEDPLTKNELINEINGGGYDAILSLLTDKIDKEVFNAMKGVKVLSNYAVGFDNIDMDTAKEMGIIVTNTPDVLIDTVAEHTIALMLSLTSRIVEGDSFVRSGKYKGWKPKLLLGTDLFNKTLAIIGAGKIGTKVAEIANNGLKMNIVYFDIKRNEMLEKKINAIFYDDIKNVLSVADVVSIHIPLMEKTRYLFNEELLMSMKKDSYIINSSRGPIIKESSLVKVLQNGHIKGAALDVFENEPMVEKELLSMNNVVLTPHIASASEETRNKMSLLAAENIIDVLEGRKPKHVIA